MRCPILITGSVTRVLAQGDFIRQVQQRLASAGYDPGPIDGKYGPRTAQALRAFQSANVSTLADQAWSQVLPGGVAVAACATYRALGLPCDEVYCDIAILSAWLGDTGRATAACLAVATAADQGIVNLRCGGPGGGGLPTLPPSTPLPGGFVVPTWIVVGVGAVVTGGLVFWLVRRARG